MVVKAAFILEETSQSYVPLRIELCGEEPTLFHQVIFREANQAGGVYRLFLSFWAR